MNTKSNKELAVVPGGNGAAPGEEEELLPALDEMTPREIVLELDKYIVGQGRAKRVRALGLCICQVELLGIQVCECEVVVGVRKVRIEL